LGGRFKKGGVQKTFPKGAHRAPGEESLKPPGGYFYPFFQGGKKKPPKKAPKEASYGGTPKGRGPP